MNRLTEHHVIESGAYMACSGPCDKDEDACGACPELEKIVDRLAAYEETGLEPEECAKYAQAEKEGRYIVLKEPRSAGVHRLEEIARADIEGRLLVLPCKVGDTVFSAFENEGVFCGKVYAISTCDGTNWFSVRYDGGLRYDHTWDEIGKTVFFAREDAEKALGGMKNDE